MTHCKFEVTLETQSHNPILKTNLFGALLIESGVSSDVHCHMRNEQSELEEIKNPSFELSQHRSRTASSWPLSSPSFSRDVMLNTLIELSSEAT